MVKYICKKNLVKYGQLWLCLKAFFWKIESFLWWKFINPGVDMPFFNHDRQPHRSSLLPLLTHCTHSRPAAISLFPPTPSLPPAWLHYIPPQLLPFNHLRRHHVGRSRTTEGQGWHHAAIRVSEGSRVMVRKQRSLVHAPTPTPSLRWSGGLRLGQYFLIVI